MPELKEVINVLPPYQGKERMVKRRQDTFDIIREIMRKHEATAPDYDKIAAQFWAGDAESTVRKIFEFLKKHTRYEVEPTLSQTVKTPAAILWEGYSHGNDCKHYASFINGICCSLQRMRYPIRTIYRFAGYDRGKRTPGHVFAVLKINGQELWVDPVLERFNQRYPRYHFHIDKIPPMGKGISGLYDISGFPNDGYVGTEYSMVMNGASGGHWLDTYYGGGVGKLHLKATDFLLPGSHEARLIHAKLKKHGLQPKATDFLIPGSGMFRRLRALHKKKKQAKVSGLPTDHIDNELAGLEDHIDGMYDNFVSGLPDEYMAGIPWDNFAVGKAKKAKDPNKKKGGFFKKVGAGLKKVAKAAGKVTMKVSMAASRNSFLLMLKLNAFHLASNIMKKVKDPGQNVTNAKVMPRSAGWQKLASFWKKMGGNDKVLWHNIVIGTGVWNKHHKNNAIHGIYSNGINGPEYLTHEETYIGVIGYLKDLPEAHAEGMGFLPAIAAAIAAAIPLIVKMKDLLHALGIDTSKIKKGASDAEADLVDNHNDGAENADAGAEAVDHGAGIKTTVEHNDDGSQTLRVDATDNASGMNTSTASRSSSGGDADPGDGSDAPAGDGGDNLPAKQTPGGGITNFMATAGEFVKAHKKPILIGASVLGLIIVYKTVIHPASRDYGYVRGKRK